MQNINLDITPGDFWQVLRFSQGDIGKEFKINVVNYDIPAGATVKCVATKPSGFGFQVAGTVSGNVVTIVSTEDMTSEAGRFPAELRIEKDSVRLGTANFFFEGEKDPHPNSTIDGTPEDPLVYNIDVLCTTAVNNWLDDHPEATTTVQDGSITKAKLATALKNEIEGKAEQTDLASLENEVGVLDARMDTFASLPEGSTSGDAELLDIRVGANGITYPSAGDAVRGQVSDLKTDLGVIYDDVTIKWVRKGGTAQGIFDTANAAKSQIISNIKNAFISDGAKCALFLYKNGTYIGKMNANYVMDKAAGSWGYYYGIIDLESIMSANGADGIVLNVSPTDGTTLSDANVQTFGDAHTKVKMDIALTENNTTKAITTTWEKGLLGANGSVYSSENGVTSGLLPNVELIEFKNGTEGGISLFFYNKGLYLGKIGANGTINKTSGDWRKLYTVVNVREITSNLNIDADSIRFSLSPTDGTTITTENAQTWGDANVAIYTSQFVPQNYFDNIINDLDAKSSIFMSLNHRGYSIIAPENTLPAFAMSKKMGFEWVEGDLEWTSDNIPVLLHDSTINRTGRNADGTSIESTININDITYEQALTYDFGIWKGAQFAGTKIPTFGEFILLCKNLGLNAVIDIKTTLTNSQIELIANSINAVGMGDNVMFATSYPTNLESLGAIFPKAILDYGIMARPLDDTDIANAISVCNSLKTSINKVTLSHFYTAVTQGQYDDLTEAGINTLVWQDVKSDFTEEDVLSFNKAVIGAFVNGINAGKVIMNNTLSQY